MTTSARPCWWLLLTLAAILSASPAVARGASLGLAAPIITIDEAPGGVVVFRIRDNSLDHLDWNSLVVRVNNRDVTTAFLAYSGPNGSVDLANTTLRVEVPLAFRIDPLDVLSAEIRRVPSFGGELAQGVQAWTDLAHATLRHLIRESVPSPFHLEAPLASPNILLSTLQHMLRLGPLLDRVELLNGEHTCFPLVWIDVAHDGSTSPSVLSPTDYLNDFWTGGGVTCISEPHRPQIFAAALEYATRIGTPSTTLLFVGHYHLATAEPEWAVFPLIAYP